MKRILIASLLGALLSGCVIVPAGHSYRGDGYYRGYGYDSYGYYPRYAYRYRDHGQ